MRVLAIGGSGGMGRHAVSLIQSFGSVTEIIVALLFFGVIVGALEFRSANIQSGVEDAINLVAPLAPSPSLPLPK